MPNLLVGSGATATEDGFVRDGGFVPLVMLKFTAFDVPPSDAGLVTVTASEPDDAIAAAGMVAVRSVELTNMVTGDAEPKFTTAAVLKFTPLIVSVKPAPPAATLVGEMDVIIGLGGGG